MPFLSILPPLLALFYLIGVITLISTLVRERSQGRRPSHLASVPIWVNKAKEAFAAALVFTTVTGSPAILLSGLIFLVSHNNTLAAVIAILMFVVDLVGIHWWSTRRSVSRSRVTVKTNDKDQPLTVHEFIAHMKMHPEFLPESISELDLERFRRRSDQSGQADGDTWLERLVDGGVHEQHAE